MKWERRVGEWKEKQKMKHTLKGETFYHADNPVKICPPGVVADFAG
jgi:hypothetical protein